MKQMLRSNDLPTRRRAAMGLLLLLVALFALGPYLYLNSAYHMGVARLGFYMAMLAATWSFLAGVGGQFSFAHVALGGLAGYAGAIWGRAWAGGHPALGSVWTSMLFGTLFALVLGTLLGLLLLRLQGAYLSLFTIAFAEIARIVVVAESDLTGGRLSLRIQALPGSERLHYYLLLVALAAVLAALYGMLRSRVGLFTRAMREDAGAAGALGVNVTQMKVGLFSITAGLVGLAASLYFHTTPRLVPENLDMVWMSLVIAYAVIGGLESPLAAALSATGMTFLLEALRRITIGPLQFEPGVWRYAIFGVLLVVTLRFARNGLLAPMLDWFAGRDQLRRETVALREQAAQKAGAVGTGSATGAGSQAAGPDDNDGGAAAVLARSGGGASDSGAAAGHLPRLREGQGRRPETRRIDLRAENLQMSYGSLRVLTGVSFAMDRPQICGLIGPNGAGKTTLTNNLTGVYPPTGGAIYLDGERVDGLPPYEMARRGLGRTFQVARAFKRMTVLENLLVPALVINPQARHRALEEQAREALQFLKMDHLRGEYARALSGGQQKLLELARLLMLDPEILILDEPFAGVHPQLKETIFGFIQRLRDEGKAFLIIEHDMETIFSISERLIVLAGGRLIADGLPAEVRKDPAVIEAYLGEDEEEAAAAPAGGGREEREQRGEGGERRDA